MPFYPTPEGYRGPPVIDFADFLSGDEEKMKYCAAAIHDAAANDGFFQIVNHTVPLTLLKGIIEAAKTFFALPEEEKVTLDKAKNEYNRGYQKLASQMIQANTTIDYKEGYYIGRELPADHPLVKAGKFGLGPNQWPESLGQEFRDTCMSYQNHMMELCEHVVQAVAMSLGYDQHFFDEWVQDPMCYYKMIHYPPPTSDKDNGLGTHRDFGAITILLQDEVPGLEYWDNRNKEFVGVQPLEGALVVNMGNMFQQWTNDVYTSVIHRVKCPPSGKDRYSFPCNFNGNPDFIIKCLEKCRKKPSDEKYPPVTVENFIRPQYADTYGRGGVYETKRTGNAVAA